MSFKFRSVRPEDLDDIVAMARQFSLLNLPADRKIISEKIKRSVDSFAGRLPKSEAQYVFVVEDIEDHRIAATSQIVAKHGTPSTPNYSFKVFKKEHFSHDLGIGFIHQVLRMDSDTDGPTEVGGLVVDGSYRRRPEKVGRLASLCRFLFIGMHLDLFEEELHAEMAPPLTEEGRSEFWEALGRRFTGMPYQEADILSTQNKEFIKTLFPQDDIYFCLLEAKARLVMGRVSKETEPALKMLERLGFKYKNKVDPFDGGPHIGVKTKDVSLIRDGCYLKVYCQDNVQFSGLGFFGFMRQQDFCAGSSAYFIEHDKLYLPSHVLTDFDLQEGDQVYFSCYR